MGKGGGRDHRGHLPPLDLEQWIWTYEQVHRAIIRGGCLYTGRIGCAGVDIEKEYFVSARKRRRKMKKYLNKQAFSPWRI